MGRFECQRCNTLEHRLGRIEPLAYRCQICNGTGYHDDEFVDAGAKMRKLREEEETNVSDLYRI